MAYYNYVSGGLGRYGRRRSYGRRGGYRKTNVFVRGLGRSRYRGRSRSRRGSKGTMFTNMKNWLPALFAFMRYENWAAAMLAGHFLGSGALVGIGAYFLVKSMKKGTVMSDAMKMPFSGHGAGGRVDSGAGSAGGSLLGMLEDSSGREFYPSAEASYLDISGASTYAMPH